MRAEAIGKLRSYHFSIVRVVPDPIRDEAINVGVIVASADSGLGRLRLRSKVKKRIRAIDSSYDFDGLSQSLSDLEDALGIVEQPGLGVGADSPATITRARLQQLASSMNNQLQLAAPQTYLAESIESALDRLFRRYVTAVREPAKAPETMTRTVLKRRIVNAVKKWASAEIKVEPDEFLHGQHSLHPADVLISNGRPKAALYAVPTQGQDKVLAYLYRDSFPTIREDMKGQVAIYAILPPKSSFASDEEREFASETRQRLGQQVGVTAAYFDELDAVKVDIVDTLF